MKIETNFKEVVEIRRKANQELERSLHEVMFSRDYDKVKRISGPFTFVAERNGNIVSVRVSDGTGEFTTELDLGKGKAEYDCQLGYLWDAMITFASSPYHFDLAKDVGL